MLFDFFVINHTSDEYRGKNVGCKARFFPRKKNTDKFNLSVLYFIYSKGVIYIGTNKVCPSFLKSFVYNRYLLSILSENFWQNSSSDL